MNVGVILQIALLILGIIKDTLDMAKQHTANIAAACTLKPNPPAPIAIPPTPPPEPEDKTLDKDLEALHKIAIDGDSN